MLIGSTGYDFISYSNGTLPAAGQVLLVTASFAAPKVCPFPVQGTVFRRLLVDVGFQTLKPQVNDTGIANTNGKLFVATPAYKSTLRSEYRLPRVADLVVTDDWQFFGCLPKDDQNLHFTGGCSTSDVGFRYAHRIPGKTSICRLTANNVTNQRCYSTIGPGTSRGPTPVAVAPFLGLTRTYAVSAQFAF